MQTADCAVIPSLSSVLVLNPSILLLFLRCAHLSPLRLREAVELINRLAAKRLPLLLNRIITHLRDQVRMGKEHGEGADKRHAMPRAELAGASRFTISR